MGWVPEPKTAIKCPKIQKIVFSKAPGGPKGALGSPLGPHGAPVAPGEGGFIVYGGFIVHR